MSQCNQQGSARNGPSGASPKTSSFRHRYLNGWPLFWLFVLPMTGFMFHAASAYDLASPEGVSQMIGYSVRWSVPFIYAVVAASALPVLFPSEASRWCLRNRRYLGLVFAVAMAWQGAFIFIISNLHTGYYYEEVYYLRDELEGSSGYLFLAAMVFTSFRFGRQFVSSAQWKVLHRCGVYFLWAYPFSVYWWNLYYYGNPDTIDYVYYWAGFLAFASRIMAWAKRRSRIASSAGTPGASAARTSPLLRALGILLVIAALSASATGGLWREAVSGFLLAPQWSANLELWLPFWPLEPFLPLIGLGLGLWCVTGGLHVAPPEQRRSAHLASSS